MGKVPVGPGTRVTLSFSLTLSSGEEIDATRGATFEVGDGNLLPGFETAIFGLVAGDSQCIEIPAEQGFGEPREENRQSMKSQHFAGMDLEMGLVVSFADPEGNELPGVVTEIRQDYVTVDFNHPLAGKDLLFDVTIEDVEQISNDIVRM